MYDLQEHNRGCIDNAAHGHRHRAQKQSAGDAQPYQEVPAAEGKGAHEKARQQGPEHVFQNGRGFFQQGPEGEKIENRDDHIAGQVADGRAHHADGRNAGEHIHREQPNHTGGNHVHNGTGYMAVGLHNGGGYQHDGVEEDADAQNGHQLGGQIQPFPGVASQQGGNGPGQHRQTNGTGNGQESGEPGGGLLRAPGAQLVSYGDLGGDGRNDADGNGGNEGAGHVEDGLGHHMDAPHGVGSLLGHAGGQQLAHIDLAGQSGDDLQAGRAQGDGNGDNQQPPGGGLEAPGLVLRLGKLLIVLVEAAEEVDGADEAAGGNAQNGAACGQGDGSGGFQQEQGGGHTHHQPDDRLDDLGDGGGEHIALALEEAPEGRHNADEQHAGAQEADGGPGIGLVLEPGQLAAEQGH